MSHVSRHSPYVDTFISITSQPSYERTKPEPPAADGSSDVRWQIGMPPYCLPAYSDVAVEPSPMRERTITDKTGTFGS